MCSHINCTSVCFLSQNKPFVHQGDSEHMHVYCIVYSIHCMYIGVNLVSAVILHFWISFRIRLSFVVPFLCRVFWVQFTERACFGLSCKINVWKKWIIVWIIICLQFCWLLGGGFKLAEVLQKTELCHMAPTATLCCYQPPSSASNSLRPR